MTTSEEAAMGMGAPTPAPEYEAPTLVTLGRLGDLTGAAELFGRELDGTYVFCGRWELYSR